MRAFLFPSLLLATGCVPVLESPEPVSDWECTTEGNTWNEGDPPPGDLVGDGFSKGKVIPDFQMKDQHGDEVCLWQFHGDVILLDISTIWCAPCQELALHTEATWQDYKDQGFTYVTILAQDLEGNDPDESDLDQWADMFGITAPIVADVGMGYTSGAVTDGNFPLVLVIDRDLVVHEKVSASDEAVRAAIEEVL